MQHYFGPAFVVTKWSLYRITIPEDLRSRPTVQKWSTKITGAELGRELNIPVTATLRHGFHVGITLRGLFQYHMPPNHVGIPLPFDQVPGIFRAKHITQTTPIVGMFLGHKHAEECYYATKPQSRKPGEAFHPTWWSDTKKTLVTIGTDHPLVVISTNAGNRFGVPAFLWDPQVPFPLVDR